MEMILRLLLRRLMALPVMILGVTALVFVVLQFTPGDPATVALGESASEAAKQLYRESHGLNDPLFVQYFRFLGNLLVLDFGVTMPPELPISSMGYLPSQPLDLSLLPQKIYLLRIAYFLNWSCFFWGCYLLYDHYLQN